MPKRELSKCREWERERRDRLKACFTALGRLLPGHEPSVVLSKLEILQRAAAYIQELQTKNRELLTGDVKLTANAQRDEIRKLHERIKKLLARNEQLAGLLRDAGIKPPNECGATTTFRGPTPLWSGRISPDRAETLRKKFENANADNGESPGTTIRVQQNRKRQRSSTVAGTPQTVKKKKRKPVERSPRVKRNASSGGRPRRRPKAVSVTGAGAASKVRQAAGGTSVGPTAAAAVASVLGPGTLILANGSVVPVPPPVPTSVRAIVTPAQIVVGTRACPPPPPPATVHVLVQQRPAVSAHLPVVTTGPNCGLPVLRPKPGLTRTTTVNKVPIPALTVAARKTATSNNASRKTVAKKKKDKEKQASTVSKKRDNEEKPSKKQQSDEIVKPTENTVEQPNDEDKQTVDELKCVPETQLQQQQPSCSVTTETTPVESTFKQSPPISSTTQLLSLDNSIGKSANVEASGANAVTKPVMSKAANQEQQLTQQLHQGQQQLHQEQQQLHQEQQQLQREQQPQQQQHDQQQAQVTQHEHEPEHSDLSNDIFASLQAAGGGAVGAHHPESLSPTAAFLLAFPLVSTLTGGSGATANSVGRGAAEPPVEDAPDSGQGSPTLLQIGAVHQPVTTTVSNAIPHDTFSGLFGSPTITKDERTPCTGYESRSRVQIDHRRHLAEENQQHPQQQQQPQQQQRQQPREERPLCTGYEQHRSLQTNPGHLTNENQQQQQLEQQQQQRAPVNWMTAPDTRPQHNLTHTQHHQQHTSHHEFAIPEQQQIFGYGGTTDAVSRPFSWSPPPAIASRLPPLLDHSLGVLPALVGDLALGGSASHQPTTISSNHGHMPHTYDQQQAQNQTQQTHQRQQQPQNQHQQQAQQQSQNQHQQAQSGGFLSVSQLVERRCPNDRQIEPNRGSSRRHSGHHHQQPQQPTQQQQQLTRRNGTTDNSKTYQQHHSASSYSAEALINGGAHGDTTGHQRRQQRQHCRYRPPPVPAVPPPPPPPPYYAAHDTQTHQYVSDEHRQRHQQQQQHNSNIVHHNHHQQQQPSQRHQQLQPDTQSYSGFIPSNTDCSTVPFSRTFDTFAHAYSTHTPARPIDTFNQHTIRPVRSSERPVPDTFSQQTTRPPRQTEERRRHTRRGRQQHTEQHQQQVAPAAVASVSGFPDLSFLPVPGTINSPLLPDDFHAPFLSNAPPPQLYASPVGQSQTLYGKHFTQPATEPSLSVVPGAGRGASPAASTTSLTNFNLSTIFPEMDRAPTVAPYGASGSGT